eukprot:TRINITY_DN2426_c0_g1_i2.p1 TRINITY_DN2426_c0_g1~~TRINITY_DN2426_c0_g1_i2.p1  ORF type:complete len:525 (-),score=62.58 TRINITY_DN2426_c0_g1_i2:566-2140(-)
MRKRKTDVAAEEEARRQKALTDRKAERSMLNTYMKRSGTTGSRARAKPTSTLPGRFGCDSPESAVTRGRVDEEKSRPAQEQLLLDSLDLQTTVRGRLERKAVEKPTEMVDSLDLDHCSLARRIGGLKQPGPHKQKSVRWVLPSEQERAGGNGPGCQEELSPAAKGPDHPSSLFGDTRPLSEYLASHTAQPGRTTMTSLTKPCVSDTETLSHARSSRPGKPSRLAAPGFGSQAQTSSKPDPPHRAPDRTPHQPNGHDSIVEPWTGGSVNWRVISSSCTSLAGERARRKQRESLGTHHSNHHHQEREEGQDGIGESSTGLFLWAEELSEQSSLSATNILKNILDPQGCPPGPFTKPAAGSLVAQCEKAESHDNSLDMVLPGSGRSYMGTTLEKICFQEHALCTSLDRLDSALLDLYGSNPKSDKKPSSTEDPFGCEAGPSSEPEYPREKFEESGTCESPKPRVIGVADFGKNGHLLDPPRGKPNVVETTGMAVLRPVGSQGRKKLGLLQPTSGRVRRGGGKTNRPG